MENKKNSKKYNSQHIEIDSQFLKYIQISETYVVLYSLSEMKIAK